MLEVDHDCQIRKKNNGAKRYLLSSSLLSSISRTDTVTLVVLDAEILYYDLKRLEQFNETSRAHLLQ